MCGIGLIHSPNKSSAEREQLAKKMHEAIAYRGPDGSGVWSNDQGLSLFHRRLAILDLSPTGAQPMISHGGRWIISFNGEIYNHKELKDLIADKVDHWKGTSDTEVLLQLIEIFGVEKAIKLCVGMFAIIVWDQKEKAFYLVRDRIGEKPLYYGKVGKDFVVGSELKVFRCHPDFKAEIDPTALAAFFKYNYVPAPYAIFKNIRKVQAGYIYKFESADLDNPVKNKYWSIPSYKDKIVAESVTYEQSKHQVKNLLLGAVEHQMQADVPLGVFLSGGVDSTLICALMTSLRTNRVDTFTIGFSDPNYDESIHAKTVAKHFGTHHTEQIIVAKDCLDAIQKMPEVYDEPFADSSQIPTYLLSKMTRQSVTVALSGDGGDELFAGYNRYAWANTVWNKTRWIPAFLRPALSNLTTKIDSEQLNKTYSHLAQFLGTSKKMENVGTKLTKGLGLARAESINEFHDMILSHWFQPDLILKGHPTFSLQAEESIKSEDFAAFMMWHDQHHYLPDDIMVKVDRASMANSLETRAPFLDHKLIEYVTSAPFENVRNIHAPKKIIKDILSEYIPMQLVERPKMGFGIPIHEWFKTDLKDLTLELLAEPYLEKQGIFNSKFVSEFAYSQLNGTLSQPYHLWSLLMFQLWHREWM